MPLDTLECKLLDLALAAQKNAYAPYSHFHVGAAFVDDQGQIFSGCNVENASYGLTNCAERTAIFSAVAQGSRHIVTMVIVTDGPELGAPCGACRQVIHEFGPQAKIILAKSADRYVCYKMSELLPHAFNMEDEVKQ